MKGKAYNKLNKFLYNVNSLTSVTKKLLVDSLVKPYINHCFYSWSNACQSLINQVDKLHMQTTLLRSTITTSHFINCFSSICQLLFSKPFIIQLQLTYVIKYILKACIFTTLVLVITRNTQTNLKEQVSDAHFPTTCS